MWISDQVAHHENIWTPLISNTRTNPVNLSKVSSSWPWKCLQPVNQPELGTGCLGGKWSEHLPVSVWGALNASICVGAFLLGKQPGLLLWWECLTWERPVCGRRLLQETSQGLVNCYRTPFGSLDAVSLLDGVNRWRSLWDSWWEPATWPSKSTIESANVYNRAQGLAQSGQSGEKASKEQELDYRAHSLEISRQHVRLRFAWDECKGCIFLHKSVELIPFSGLLIHTMLFL